VTGAAARRFALALGLGVVATSPLVAFAQGAAPTTALANDAFGARPLVLVLVLAALALLPFVLIMVTSFVKIAVVLSILRNALGVQQIPPNQVITGLAIVLTAYVMSPVAAEIEREAKPLFQQDHKKGVMSAETVDLILKAGDKAKGPVRAFLERHSHAKDRAFFTEMARKLRKPEDRGAVAESDFLVLIPSFVVSELKEAFQIGFVIFLPFLILDMVIANILLALGMHMLSPTTISLPFKFLLFILVDGWHLVARGLVAGYGFPGAGP
jgi:type III secretion protein R